MKVKELIKMMLVGDITEIWVSSDTGEVSMYKPHEHDLILKDFGDREIEYWHIGSYPLCSIIELNIRVK